ncbi:uncharacterized protein LOC135219888 isoform X1 [Macrobrachium nipponense]|uniref:uncharacterized protein LOC135219888 isoform X1 n=1 Tax=Macrobrachium nipponense TaxID=159736 RepID=UPI0030C8BC13
MSEIQVPPGLVDAVDSLKEALKAGRTDIFRKLLDACETTDNGGGIQERKQLINSLATEDGTFLHMATKLGRGDILRALLAAGADPGVQDASGNTPLQLAPSPPILAIFTEELLRATAQSDVGRVCQLVAAGLSINSHDNPLSRNTPLHWAASFADVDTLSCLLARGADVNAANSDGATPLHDAVARGDEDIIRILLENGANLHIQCYKGRHKGKTAYELASRNPQLHNFMEEYASLINKDSQVNGSSTCNGSVSPLIARRSLTTQELAKSRVVSGSMESLVSMGTDSVLTGVEPGSVGDALLRKTSVESPVPRSPLQSSSSLEMSPCMEQVCERLASSQLTAPPRPLVTHSELHSLWPQPCRITEIEGPNWIPPSHATLAVVSGVEPVHKIVDVWGVHKLWLEEVGCYVSLGGVVGSHDPPSDHTFTCIVDPSLTTHPHQYILSILNKKVNMVCGSIDSLHNCLVTFVQLLRVCHSSEEGGGKVIVPPLVIRDQPSLPHRGFLLDVAPHARVPTLERLCQMVDSLLGLKMNQLHLLMRVSSVACSLPYSPSEVVSLDRYCCDRGITLVPAFDVEVSVPTAQLGAITGTIKTTLTHFPSIRFVHLGPRLTALLADASLCSKTVGSSPQTVCSPWAQLGLSSSAVLLVCANVFHNKSQQLAALPPTTILVEYGFQADYDFSRGVQLAVENGRALTMCPGTAAWSSLSGWPEAGVSNVYNGIVSGAEGGAGGVVVAHWSSSAALTPLVFAWPPVLVAAGLSWNHNTHWDYVHSSVGALIDTHLVRVPLCGMGAALIELGRCETWVTRMVRGQPAADVVNLPSSSPGSALYQLLADPDSLSLDNLTPEVFTSVMRHVRKAVREGRRSGGIPGQKSPLIVNGAISGGVGQETASSPWPLATLVTLELHLAMDMILTACRLGRSLVSVGTNPRSNMGVAVVNLGVGNLPPTLRTDLANKVLALREVYSSVWMQGQQAAGLQSSLLVLTSLLARLLPDHSLHPS